MPATALQEPTVTPELRRYITAHRAIRLTEDGRPPARVIECMSDDEYAALLSTMQNGAPRLFKRVTAHDVCCTVAQHFEISVIELKSRSRWLRLVNPRHIAMFIIIHCLGYTSTQAGIALGGRDHTTVLGGYHKVRKRVATEPQFASEVREIIRLCGLEHRP